MKYRNEYRYSARFGRPEHIWTVVGKLGGIHFHVTDLADDNLGERFSAGLEIHSRAPLSDAPPE